MSIYLRSQGRQLRQLLLEMEIFLSSVGRLVLALELVLWSDNDAGDSISLRSRHFPLQSDRIDSVANSFAQQSLYLVRGINSNAHLCSL